jgi:hypothetical protein
MNDIQTIDPSLPWKVRKAWANDDECEIYPTYKGKRPQFGRWSEIAVVKGNSAKEARKRARLMAAAPDLLNALKGVLRVADRQTVEFDAARAAIAKAESSK